MVSDCGSLRDAQMQAGHSNESDDSALMQLRVMLRRRKRLGLPAAPPAYAGRLNSSAASQQVTFAVIAPKA